MRSGENAARSRQALPHSRWYHARPSRDTRSGQRRHLNIRKRH